MNKSWAVVSKKWQARSKTVVLLKEVPESPDAGLVESFRAGDTSAFEELVRRYKDRVYQVVYRYVGNHEDARDIAQETFIRAYRGINAFRGQSQVYTWLYSIAANLAKNKLRDGHRKGRDLPVSLDALRESRPGAGEAADRGGDNPRSAAQQHELDEGLQLCLKALPENFRLAFVLRVFDDLSYEDIALTSGVPQGTVKSRLNQARRRLRDCLRLRHLL